MDPLRNPGALAGLVARHLVPVAGVAFLGWSPGNILVLLALDTLLALTGLGLLVAIHVTGLDHRPPAGSAPVRWGRVVLALPVFIAVFAIPVALPLVGIIDLVEWRPEALADPGFRTGLALQALASALAFGRMHRSLAERYDDQKVLARAFIDVLARWIVLSIVVFVGVTGWLGPRLGGALLILVYGAASVWFELFPSQAARFIRGRGAKPLEQVIAEDTVKEARSAARTRRRAK